MKRHGDLWEKIIDLENIKFAHQQARKGKSYYKEVQRIDKNIDMYAYEIQQMLINKTFTTSEYRVEEKFDGRKNRTIYKLPYYPDRIVQHALLNVVGPIITNTFIRDTFQSIKGRGTKDAAERVKKLIRSNQCPRYALKIDVEKFYPSVNNEIMKQFIRRKIKDKNVLWLIDDIIDSIDGLPIGNYTSQHFGNLYLSSIDWWMKQVIKPAGYFRYCDDVLIFNNSTKDLIKIKNMIVGKMNDIRLSIKANWTIYNVPRNGVNFVGFIFKSDKTLLRKSIVTRFKNLCTKLHSDKVVSTNSLSSLMAYKGWVKLSNSKELWRKYTAPLVTVYPKQLRCAI